MQTLDLQTLDSRTLDWVVIDTSTRESWRASRERRLLAIASLAALACGALAWLERPVAAPDTPAPPKLAARISIAPDRTPTADELRLAAFQEAVALSLVTPASPVSGDATPLPDAAGAKPAHRPNRAVPVLAKREAAMAIPVPPPRPVTPMVIEAELPPAPPPDPSYLDASLQAMGDAARGVALAPERARDVAAAALDRWSGALAKARARVGF
jgi:hypothetical protein